MKTSIFFNKKTAMIAVFMAYEPQVVNWQHGLGINVVMIRTATLVLAN